MHPRRLVAIQIPSNLQSRAQLLKWLYNTFSQKALNQEDIDSLLAYCQRIQYRKGVEAVQEAMERHAHIERLQARGYKPGVKFFFGQTQKVVLLVGFSYTAVKLQNLDSRRTTWWMGGLGWLDEVEPITDEESESEDG
jgi:hypothetical protein